jgi:chromosome partition protein MukE
VKEHPYDRLEDVVQDDIFPEVDLALREGRHIDRDDGDRFTFLCDAQKFLEDFYRRYGCMLVRVTDGYFYLLPSNDQFGRRQLTGAEMVSGQALALMYLDPASIEAAGVVSRQQVIELLSGLLGRERLIQILDFRRKRRDEKVEQDVIRKGIDAALRTLTTLGFIAKVDEDRFRLRAPLTRFIEPVRGLGDPREALARLVARGEAAVAQEEDEE